ncbi:MAG: DNA polymerase III subunit chi [Pseudomonadota bacterium]
MTQVDFYLLNETSAQARHLVACRIVEKAFQTQQTVYIHVDTPREASQIDDLLWSFRPGSFIPHRVNTTDQEAAQVTISATPQTSCSAHVLVNLSQHVPEFFQQFARVVEIVEGDEQTRQRGRERFRYYRNIGITPLTHHLT